MPLIGNRAGGLPNQTSHVTESTQFPYVQMTSFDRQLSYVRCIEDYFRRMSKGTSKLGARLLGAHKKTGLLTGFFKICC
jgi:hypothetical protein